MAGCEKTLVEGGCTVAQAGLILGPVDNRVQQAAARSAPASRVRKLMPRRGDDAHEARPRLLLVSARRAPRSFGRRLFPFGARSAGRVSTSTAIIVLRLRFLP